jgi:hypothetical protein
MDDPLRDLRETLDPEVRDDLRRVLIRDQLRPRCDLQAGGRRRSTTVKTSPGSRHA